MIKLSVCLIVKDEEPVLARCLGCAVRFADELIVVDTGSSDNSVGIARRFTPLVYQHPWQGSFAEARNYSYSKATGDYIMWLDADDVIDDDNIARFNRLKEETDKGTDIIFTIYRNFSETGLTSYVLRDRIIKRSLEAQWEFDVHECIRVRKEWNCLYATDIEIVHKKEHVNEPGRNISIYDRLLGENKDLSLIEKVNLCKDYYHNGHHKEVLRIFQETVSQLDEQEYMFVLPYLLGSLQQEGRYAECLIEIERAEEHLSLTARLIYIKAFCLEKLGRKNEAEVQYLQAIDTPDDPETLAVIHTGYNDYYPYLRLASLAVGDGDKNSALQYLSRASQAYPKDRQWQALLLTILRSMGDRDDSVALLTHGIHGQ